MIKTQEPKEEEGKYDAKWKQNIQLSDEEGSQARMIIVSSDEENEEYNTKQQVQLPLDLKESDIKLSQLEPLIYMDEPGLQMYVSQDPDISALLQCFLPKTLFEMFQQNINNSLMQIIQNDTPNETQAQVLFNKKRFGDQEITQYLGTSILFGVFRFPVLSHYWQAESYLKGGIEICIQEGRYKFIDQRMMMIERESEQQKALHLTGEIRKKWKKMYKPDQELILWSQRCLTHTSYYLIDSETLFLLDQAVIFKDQEDTQVLTMIMSFNQKNHVVYFQRDALTLEQILKLVEVSIYPVGEFSLSKLPQNEENIQFKEQFAQKNKTYYNSKICFTLMDDEIVFVFPRKKLKLDGDQEQLATIRFSQQLEHFLDKASKRILFIEIYKCPFGYTNQLNTQMVQLYKDISDGNQSVSPTINYVRVLFEEYLEGTIYNMFSFFNSILINNQQRQNYKQFKLAVAGALIGDKYQQLERDRKELKRKQNLQTKEQNTQTDKLSFGLPKSYSTSEYHLPIQEHRQFQVKYCVVCMKYENLSKSYFNCLQCYRQFGSKVFLCVFPCFELFHRNPTQFIDVEASLVSKVKDDKYFKVEAKITLDPAGEMASHYDRNNKVPSVEKPILTRDGKLQPQIPGAPMPRIPLRNNPMTAAAMAARPNARTAPQHYNWSYNRGFRRKGDEDDPIEKDFEELINNLNQQSVDLLTRPQNPKNPSSLHSISAQHLQNRMGSTINKAITQTNESNLPTQPVEHKSILKETKNTQKINQRVANQDIEPQQKIQKSQDEPSFKSPFEKWMEEVKRKNQVDRMQKQEERAE